MIGCAVSTWPSKSLGAECSALIAACDKALEAKDNVIVAKDTIIKKQDDLNGMLNQRVIELENSQNSIFKNPFVLIGLGVIGGFVLAK